MHLSNEALIKHSWSVPDKLGFRFWLLNQMEQI